jgi:anti-anti-sigma factor
MLELKLLTSDTNATAGNDVVQLETSGTVSRDGWGMGTNPIEQACGPDIYSKKVLLSMATCRYLDSTGVEWLLRCHKRFATAGGMLVIHSVAPVVGQILKMMRMELVLNLAENEAQALRIAQGANHGDG